MTTERIPGIPPVNLRDAPGVRYLRDVRLEVTTMPLPPPEPTPPYFNAVRRLLVAQGEIPGDPTTVDAPLPLGFTAVFQNLRIAFDIPNSADSTESPVKIEVYNVSHTTAQRVIPTTTERTVLRLWAGYSNTPNLVFVGQALKGSISIERPNSVLKFQAEHIDDLKRIPFIVSYEETNPPRPRRRIVEYIVDRTGLIIDSVSLRRIPTDAVVKTFVSEGTSADALTALLDPIDISWFVHNGVFGVMSKRRFDVYDSEIVIISQETGMINVPTPTEDGVDVQLLLTPTFVPGQSVQINTRLLSDAIPQDKVYRVVNVAHQGDNWTDRMVTTLKLEDPDKINRSPQQNSALITDALTETG